MTLIKIISDLSCSSAACVYIASDSIHNNFSSGALSWFYCLFSVMPPILPHSFSLPLSLCVCSCIALNSTALQCERYTDVYRFMYDQLDGIESKKKWCMDGFQKEDCISDFGEKDIFHGWNRILQSVSLLCFLFSIFSKRYQYRKNTSCLSFITG